MGEQGEGRKGQVKQAALAQDPQRGPRRTSGTGATFDSTPLNYPNPSNPTLNTQYFLPFKILVYHTCFHTLTAI